MNAGAAFQKLRQRTLPPEKNSGMFPNKHTIVIVDDDREVGNALKRGLAAQGYKAEVHRSSAECLNADVTRVATCFVIDVHLDNESGIDLSAQLSSIGIKSPVIHMSGSAVEAVRQEALASGCFAFLDKPFAIQDLIKIIDRATGRAST
jgi:FixJ family two-component response regulator